MSPTGTNMGGQFGDTTHTKVFVGGLAWETQKETMKSYFEQFGDILEAVVISDKATGRSKGYGFVTFREPEAAARSCADPAPVIDGRRANCNLASLGVQRSKPSTPKHGGGGGGNRKYRAMGTFPSATTLPVPGHRYALQLQQPLPYNLYTPASASAAHAHGYSPYSPDYSYPTSYYNVYGGATTQYPIYGGGMMTGAAAAFYPYFQFGGEGAGATPGGGGYSSGQSYGVQYPPHHQFFQYPATSGYPHHYGAPISLAPSPIVQSSGLTMVLHHAPMPHL